MLNEELKLETESGGRGMVVELDIIGWSCKITLAVYSYRKFTVKV